MSGLRTGWVTDHSLRFKFKGHDQGLGGGLSMVIPSKVQYWAQHCLTCSAMTWMKGQRSPQQGH